jgi:hypothetical protein
MLTPEGERPPGAADTDDIDRRGLFVLVVDGPDYEPPDVHGLFATPREAMLFAERYRAKNIDPALAQATPENNEAWTDRDWYFGVQELKPPTGLES